jgi:hypothetical protein
MIDFNHKIVNDLDNAAFPLSAIPDEPAAVILFVADFFRDLVYFAVNMFNAACVA